VFWDKILELDFSGLIQSAQPGITVYWFTGFLVAFIPKDGVAFSLLINIFKAFREQNINYNNFVNLNNANTYAFYQDTSFLFNAPLFLLLTIFYILFYFLLRKIGFNRIISGLSLLLLTTNMYLAYWTTPADKMLVIFSVLSLLTFLVYMDQKPRKKYLALSAIFGALAVLSKISALFIIPFFFSAYVFYVWPLNIAKVKIILKDLSIWALIFFIVCVVFLPTIVVFPGEVYSLIFRPSTVYETNYGIAAYVNRTDAFSEVFGMISASSIVRSLVLSFVFSAIVLSVSVPYKKYRKILDFTPCKHTITITIFILAFILMVTLVSKNHDIRQMSPAFAMLSIVVAVGVYNAIGIIKKRLNIQNEYIYLLVISLIAGIQLASIFHGGSYVGAIILRYIG
jgi:hypothetical protein